MTLRLPVALSVSFADSSPTGGAKSTPVGAGQAVVRQTCSQLRLTTRLPGLTAVRLAPPSGELARRPQGGETERGAQARRVLTTPRPVCIIICSQVAISRRAARKGRPAAHFARGMPPHGGTMNHCKRILAALAAAFAALALLAGCSPSHPRPEDAGAAPAPGTGGEAELRVVATTFPLYDWARQVLGQTPGIELVWLQDTGVDMHSYQPTAADMLLVSSCDLFLYVGGTSDSWVDDALQEAVNQDMEVLSLLDVLGSAARLEELTEGMQAAHEDHDGHAHAEAEYDEHIWLSLRNAQLLTGAIADAMGRMDPAHAEDFAANAAAYGQQLAALDAEYQAAVDAAPVHTLLFGDRFPFRYLVEDYGLDYYAAFPGCSAETEASFETVAFLAGKVQELDLPAVLAIDHSDHRVAQTIAQNAGNGAAVLTLDSMQGVSSEDVRAGATYLSIMASNLDVLKQALA